MSIPSCDELQLETVAQQTQEQTQREDAVLVEMGKVSDTHGGILGVKLDAGSGWQNF